MTNPKFHQERMHLLNCMQALADRIEAADCAPMIIDPKAAHALRGLIAELRSAQEVSSLEIKKPNESGAAQCIVQWQIETQLGWVGAWNKDALQYLLSGAPSSAFDPADMATAAAQGFRDGVAYVQKNAEIKHVADDVSKNGKESNTSTGRWWSTELQRWIYTEEVDPVEAERTRCIQAINNTLASWRCVPSQHIREFAELCIKAIEKPEDHR